MFESFSYHFVVGCELRASKIDALRNIMHFYLIPSISISYSGQYDKCIIQNFVLEVVYIYSLMYASNVKLSNETFKPITRRLMAVLINIWGSFSFETSLTLLFN